MLVSIGARPKHGDDLAGRLLACHDRIRQFLQLARTVAAGGAPAAEIVDACGRVARYFREAFPLHVRDEEDSILPRLRSPELDPVLAAMESQHAEHEALHAALLDAVARVAEAPEDPARRSTLGAVADAFAAEIEPHLQLEERDLIPELRRLPAAVQAEIIAELEARRGS